jgi:hypothetical protein
MKQGGNTILPSIDATALEVEIPQCPFVPFPEEWRDPET